jgi:pimeloyl-ACP methyl ester carboxylesterase
MSEKNRQSWRGILSFNKGMLSRLLLLTGLLIPVSCMTQAKDLTFSEKDVHFYSGNGLKLAGVLSTPSKCNENNQCPGLVLIYGPGGYNRPDIAKEVKTMLALSSRLVESGFVTLTFTYRGVGLSEGPAYRLIPMEQVEDVQNAITFLEQHKAVNTKKIGLAGFATGGANASYVAAIDERVQAMVSINGMGDLGRWMREIRPYWQWLEFKEMLEKDRISRVLGGSSRLLRQRDVILNDPSSKRFRADMEEKYPEIREIKTLLTLESAEAMSKFQPETLVKNISPRAALWIAPEFDTLLPVEHSRRMYANAGEPKKLIIMKGEEHHSIYRDEGLDKLIVHVNDWFVSQLMKK